MRIQKCMWACSDWNATAATLHRPGYRLSCTRHLFPLDHGGEGEIACETCHENSYVELTCYGCHDHQLGEMIEVHAAEEIGEGIDVVEEQCIDCHPTGKETGQENLDGGDERDR